ncbi:ExbD/TolR family protein [Duganella vulcania]|uniref:Uncharacterized protein n=1 Tax=Duganella vulcania TaxID=2692166 RepID=A0A845GM76_9BURK|nr:biopolymer transporter ExbD [Duganella vulcania]MYM94456.1 hypothetical protein [Duganella vulcania]
MRLGVKISLMALILISGCAIEEKRTEIAISSFEFKVDGETYTSRQSLAAALISKKVKRVQFLPDKNTSYQQVKAAMEAAQEAGVADIGLVGNVRDNE